MSDLVEREIVREKMLKYGFTAPDMTVHEFIEDELPSVTQKPIECEDVVSRGVFEQVMWERDIAIEQLHELGYELGQKIEPCDDAISRQAVCDYIAEFVNNEYSTQAECEMVDLMIEGIQHLPSVTQKSGKWLITPMSHIAYCSKCDYLFKNIPASIVKQFKYCPNCGYYMIELRESEKVNCKSTKCENCINHNYCDYESQKSEERNMV